MNNTLKKIGYTMLGMSGILYAMFFMYTIYFKWRHFLYNEIDLAIFGQILAHMGPGHWFDNSIQQVNYFGDHVIPILILLTPLYRLFNHALVLVAIQFLAILGAGYLLYRYTSKLYTQDMGINSMLVLPFLLSVSVFSMVFHGFHMLPFFFILYFSLWYFYKQEHFWQYGLVLAGLLLLREDMPLIVVAFSAIPLIEKRSLKWWLTPLISGLIYFFAAQYISGLVNATGGGKFMVYYDWMGSTPFEIVQFMLMHPIQVLEHVLQYHTSVFLVITFLPFILVLWRKWYWALPALAYMGVFILVEVPDMLLVFSTHYMAPILGALVIAYIEGFMHVGKKLQHMSIIVSLAAIIFVHNFFGLPLFMRALSPKGLAMSEAEYEEVWEVIDAIPDGSRVLSSTAFLPYLVDHQYLYNLVYAFPGKTQYGLDDYRIEHLDFAIIDTHEITAYYLQYINEINHAEFESSPQRMQDLLEEHGLCLQNVIGGIHVYTKDTCVADMSWQSAGVFNSEVGSYMFHDLEVSESGIKRLRVKNMGLEGNWYWVRWADQAAQIMPLAGGLVDIHSLNPQDSFYHYFTGCGQLEIVKNIEGYNYFDPINHRRQEYTDVEVVDVLEIPCK
jgi:uncharacterized membrane protein